METIFRWKMEVENIPNFPSSGVELLTRIIGHIKIREFENAEKHVRFLRSICHDELNTGKYENVELHWRHGYYY